MGDDLDALTSQLAEGFQVDPAALGEHPRYSQFKNYTKAAEQQAKRRQEALDRQKNGRDDKIQKLRNLAYDDTTSDEEDSKAAGASDTDFKVVGYKEKPRQKKFSDRLLLSEWLVDIPETLSTEWTMVMAPVGKRTLVVASRGVTSAYNKGGRQVAQFQSHLPGGSTTGRNQAWTILDCIYHNQVYYILDVLSWNSHQYDYNPFDLRQFIITSKLEEMPELAAPTPGYRYTFMGLPKCPCSIEEMTKLMATTIPWRVDGLLFYHNSVLYEPGQSPLVGWLKPWMLPEILNVPIPERYAKLSKGRTSAQYIENFNQAHKHHSKIDRSMEH